MLYKQDELRELEARLDRIDQLDAKRDASLLLSRAKDDACGSRRKMLLQEIDVKFKDYGKSYLKYFQVCDFPALHPDVSFQ